MKKLWVAAGIASGLFLVANGASAADVQLQFTGKISKETCAVEGGGGTTLVKDVPLQPVGTSFLSTAGSVAGQTPVKFTLKNCSGSKVSTSFSSNSVDPNTGALKNELPAGPEASNVQVQLLNSQRQPIHLENSTNVETVSIVEGNAELKFYAQYYAAMDDTTVGDVKTSVMMDLVYE